MRALLKRIGIIAALLLLAPLGLAWAGAKGDCPNAKLPAISLPQVKRAIAHEPQLTIVALGSSSTEGARASDPAHTYPAILQAELQSALPSLQVKVLNRGVGGQDAAEELSRLEKDVVAPSPALVIWQVGANGAMRGVDPELFKRLVASGVRRLEAAGIDVVLMDNQRAPAVLASAQHAKIDSALADVAVHYRAGLFPRGRLMDLWRDEGFPYAQFVSDDGVHHNDRGYKCLAQALAAAILDGLGPDIAAPSLQATRLTTPAASRRLAP